jgi:cytochrome bd ubiquinol oxidase subunit I
VDTNTLDFARLEFGLTAGTHFLFVGLTLGLATLVAVIQTRATVTGDPVQERMVRFWGQLYIINYAVGIVTGLVMELELGLNWSGLEHFAGNVFGSSLALETITAFFLESTFLGLWIFGWGRMNKWAHVAVLWVVTITAYASAYWIMVSNGFLQHPVGSRVVNGVLQLDSAAKVLSNESTLMAFGHILGAGLVTAGLFVAGVSAYHLRRGTPERDFFIRSLRIGLWTTLPALILTAALGGSQFGVISDTQPLKMAVFGGDTVEIARDQAAAVARFGPGSYIPSAGFAKAGYVMIGCWVLMTIITIIALRRLRARRLDPAAGRPRPRSAPSRVYGLLVLAIPLPFIALIAGWLWRETGRQPWTVFGLLRTSDAVSHVSAGTMRASLLAFTALFAVLLVVNYWLLARFARRGPEAATLGRPVGEDAAGLLTNPPVNPAF